MLMHISSHAPEQGSSAITAGPGTKGPGSRLDPACSLRRAVPPNSSAQKEKDKRWFYNALRSGEGTVCYAALLQQ